MTHTVVDDVHELQLFALTTGRRVILTDGHSLRFLSSLLGLEHRKRKFHADPIVALPQFLELLLCNVQLPSRIEVDRVDEKVRVDVVTMVYPFDVATGSELTNSSMTENGFRLDLAKSRYLKVNIKREVLKDSPDGLVEDTRFNGPAKDGAEYTDEGI